MSCTYVTSYENEMRRRSEPDLVKTVVNSYLRRRHYMETDHLRKSDVTLNHNCKQMAVAATVEKDASRLNSVSFSSITNDSGLAEQQFTKLKTWITAQGDGKCRQELQALLFPLLCHFYLEMLRLGGDRQTASKFLKRHQDLFVSTENSRDFIEELSLVLTFQDIESKPLIKSFRLSKYEIKMSSTTMATLQKYLSTQNNIILLQVLQTWFDIEVLSNDCALESDEEFIDISSNENADYLESLYQQTHEDKEMNQLQDAIRLVRSSPTPPPPVLLYTLNNSESACCAQVSRSGKLLATGYSSSLLKLWSLSEAKVSTMPSQRPSVPLACLTPQQVHTVQDQRHSNLRGHCGPVTGTEFLPDAEVLLSVSHDTTMRAWRLSDFSPAAIYRGHNYPIWCVTASSFGVYIATGSHDLTARLWSLDRTYPLRIFAGHSQDVNCVQFHPNSSYLATGSTDRSIRLWSVTDGTLVRVYSGNCGSVLAVAFSPNGQLLASAGDDRRVKVWDLASGAQLADLKGHTLPVTALDWSRDSNILASASMDGTVLLWNASLHFKPTASEGTENPAKYSTTCSSLLSLQCLPRGNLVTVGTV